MANVQDRGPPSAAAIAISSAIIAGLAGYFLGSARSVGLLGSPVTRQQSSSNAGEDGAKGSDVSGPSRDETDGEDDEDTQDLGELKTFPGNTEECKLVLLVRTDLGMTKGKIAAQCGHATLACYKTMLRADTNKHPLLKRWERSGQAKVALKVESEDDMLTLQATAVSLGLCAQVIHDAGRTQIARGSATVLGIGPAPKSKIDEVSGHLKLL